MVDSTVAGSYEGHSGYDSVSCVRSMMIFIDINSNPSS
jgi:hypothetical protein